MSTIQSSALHIVDRNLFQVVFTPNPSNLHTVHSLIKPDTDLAATSVADAMLAVSLIYTISCSPPLSDLLSERSKTLSQIYTFLAAETLYTPRHHGVYIQSSPVRYPYLTPLPPFHRLYLPPRTTTLPGSSQSSSSTFHRLSPTSNLLFFLAFSSLIACTGRNSGQRSFLQAFSLQWA